MTPKYLADCQSGGGARARFGVLFYQKWWLRPVSTVGLVHGKQTLNNHFNGVPTRRETQELEGAPVSGDRHSFFVPSCILSIICMAAGNDPLLGVRCAHVRPLPGGEGAGARAAGRRAFGGSSRAEFLNKRRSALKGGCGGALCRVKSAA